MSSITVCLRILILALCLSGFPGLAADAVVDAEEFSSDELSRLRESQRPDLLLGGGIQAQPQNDLGLALLEEAAAAGQPHPAVLATLLERLLSRMYIKIPTPDLDARIDDAISRLSRVSTPNALPGLVEAVVSAQRGRGTALVLAQMRHANEAPIFASYALDRFAAVAGAGQYLGRGSNESYGYAVGSASLIRVPMLTRFTCRDLGANSVEIAEQCVLVGRKMEQDAKTMIDALIATAIESIAFHHPALRTGANRARWKGLNERRKGFQDLYKRVGEVGDPCSNDRTCSIYFGKFKEQGEISAMKWFVKHKAASRHAS